MTRREGRANPRLVPPGARQELDGVHGTRRVRRAIAGLVVPVLALGRAAVAEHPAVAAQEPPARRLADLNWMEVGELVPGRIRTVLLPVGTLEAHGVVPNGADILVPDSLASRLAPDFDALIAPALAYGVHTSLDEYPGTFGISDTLLRETEARILVLNWWSVTPDVTEEVYGTRGGHAGNNETAAVLALRPDLVRAERYVGPEQATPFGTGWQAWPFPSSIGLYAPGEGYPDFDRDKATHYFEGVVERVRELVLDVIAKWDRAGL
ncbi:MAG: creatininase family protein [Gemmatimonadota bacterium]